MTLIQHPGGGHCGECKGRGSTNKKAGASEEEDGRDRSEAGQRLAALSYNRGWLFPPRGIVRRHFWSSQLETGQCYWHLVGSSQWLSYRHRTGPALPHNREHQASNVSIAAVEKLWLETEPVVQRRGQHSRPVVWAGATGHLHLGTSALEDRAWPFCGYVHVMGTSCWVWAHAQKVRPLDGRDLWLWGEGEEPWAHTWPVHVQHEEFFEEGQDF